ncbi:hypothetical protein [Snuella sedimenti]|uniref:Uncharacterized protein n=1 Tax=Snuella sedimenti TaxID=2798802 RepID=A0A8J7IJK9_9FLAO|nr:hypothetical protein [Snuella sedimenti]MBJ6369451.1 hypothetical protein [Snuella sedimenti]
MKKILLILLLVTGYSYANDLNTVSFDNDKPKVGDVLVINATSNTKYNHISFPKLNTIVKRGGLANYKTVHGQKVIIKKVIDNNDGSTTVVLVSKDKTKFFGFLKSVKANYHKSVDSGELSKIN